MVCAIWAALPALSVTVGVLTIHLQRRGWTL
jgi:hypothetical protein